MLGWLKAKVGDKPAWAIVVGAMLAAVGTGIVGLVPGAYEWATREVAGGDDLRFLVREKATSRPLDGAIIEILAFPELNPVALQKDGRQQLVTQNGGAAIRTPLPRGDYALRVKYRFDGRDYYHMSPIALSGSMLHNVDFSPTEGWWAQGSPQQTAQIASPLTAAPVVQTQIVRTVVERLASRPSESSPAPSSVDAARWMNIASLEIGQTETPGEASNPRILEYIRSVGRADSDFGDEFPWNSAFANWVLQKAGVDSPNTHQARAWLRWGRSVELQPGCVAIFWRGSPTAFTGHVAFHLRTVGDQIEVMGGNQANGVNVSRIDKGRFLGCRMPA